jgi:hypothetical protein
MKIETHLNSLFISQTRAKLISTLFSQPGEMRYVRELVRLVREEINSVRRELQNLTRTHLLLTESRGNRLYYRPNPRHPLFLLCLEIAYRQSSLATELSSADFVFVSLPFCHNLPYHPDKIDIVVVGDMSYKQVENVIKSQEKNRHREINYMVMDSSELSLRRSKRDPIITDFFLQLPLVIVGNPLPKNDQTA